MKLFCRGAHSLNFSFLAVQMCWQWILILLLYQKSIYFTLLLEEYSHWIWNSGKIHFYLSTLKILFHCLPASIFFDGKSTVNCVVVSLLSQGWFPLPAFKILLSLVVNSLTVLCFNVVFSYLYYLGFAEILKSVILCLTSNTEKFSPLFLQTILSLLLFQELLLHLCELF